MAAAYEYLVCQTQWSYVTFANGQWQGTIDYRVSDPDTAYKSCPHVWEYLQQAGHEGWELVCAVTQTTVTTANTGTSQASNQLFLKRVLS